MIPDYVQNRGHIYAVSNPTDLPKEEDGVGIGMVQRVEIKKSDFGSAIRTKTRSEHEKMEKSYKKELKQSIRQAKRDAILRGQIYIPKTPETRSAYNDLTADLSQLLGPVNDETLHQAAYDLIVVFRDANKSDDIVAQRVENTLGFRPSFAEIRRLHDRASQLNDFQPSVKVQEMQDAENDDGIVSITADDNTPLNSSDETESSEDEQELPINVPEEDKSGGWTISELQKFCEENFGVESEQKKAEIISALKNSDGINLEMQLVCIIGPRESEVKAISRSKHLIIENPQKVEKYSKIDLSVYENKRENTRIYGFQLPETSTSESTEKYEKIFIPPPKNHATGIRLSVDALDEKYQTIIGREITSQGSLNLIQSKVYQQIEESNENLLISAPTGAGKTIIAVLAMIKTLLTENNSKAIYIAPMKSLVQEMVAKFTEIFDRYKKVIELTGDSSASVTQLQGYDIIVSTPEKLDIISRKTGNQTFIDTIKLVIIDEIHLLHNSRGPVLEALVSRLKMLKYVQSSDIRLIGLSATMPNVGDIAEFLQVPEQGLFVFGEEYRPCLLHKTFVGFKERKKVHLKASMNEYCYQIIEETLKNKHQTLIFVHSRREAQDTALAFYNMAISKGEADNFVNDQNYLQNISEGIINEKLKSILPKGFAFHHAGLVRDDRSKIEEEFRNKRIKVLVSTATLAWGVNLPAHIAIIKGTNIYNPELGDFDNLSHLDVLQMFGRAGRPGLDIYGEAYLLTEHQNLHYYVSALTSQIPIESHFLREITNHLNAEIALGTIGTVAQGVDWLKETFLYIRMQKSPKMYGLSKNVKIEQRLADLIHSSCLKLSEKKLIFYNTSEDTIESTDIGRIAANYYITEETMSNFVINLSTDINDVDLLRLFSLASEFKNVVVRPQEVSTVKKFQEMVPIPIKGQPDDPKTKINVLLQSYISRIKSESFEMMADLVYISQSAERLFRCLFELSISKGLSEPALLCLSYAKMVNKRMWEVQNPLWQFGNIPENYLNAIDHFDNWHKYYEVEREALKEKSDKEFCNLCKTDKIEIGKTIKDDFLRLPQLKVTCTPKIISKDLLRITVKVRSFYIYDYDYHFDFENFWIFLVNGTGDQIIYSERFTMQSEVTKDYHITELEILTNYEKMEPFYFVKIVSDKFLNSQTEVAIPIRLYQDKKLTENCHNAQKVMSKTNDGLTHYLTEFLSENLLYVCQPYSVNLNDQFTTVMKSVCCSAKCLIIVPNIEKFTYLCQFFVDNQNVFALSGDEVNDKYALDQGKSIICSLNMLSNFDRFYMSEIFDFVFLYDLHLISSKEYSKYEEIISQIKIVYSKEKTKIVAQTYESDDFYLQILAKFIESDKIFVDIPDNFCQMELIPVSFSSYRARKVSMMRPTFSKVATFLQNDKQSIVFVSNDAEIKETFVNYTNLLKKHFDEVIGYKLDNDENLPPIFREDYRELSRRYGITYFSNTISDDSKKAVIDNFMLGKIKILICSVDSINSLHVKSDLVIIKGTDYLDLRNSQREYEFYDILEMISKTKSDGEYFIYTQENKFQMYFILLKNGMPVQSFIDFERFTNMSLFNYYLSSSYRLLEIAKETNPTIFEISQKIFFGLQKPQFSKFYDDPVFDSQFIEYVKNGLLDYLSGEEKTDENLISINHKTVSILYSDKNEPQFEYNNEPQSLLYRLVRSFTKLSVLDVLRMSLFFVVQNATNSDNFINFDIPDCFHFDENENLLMEYYGIICGRHGVRPSTIISLSKFSFTENSEHPISFISSIPEIYESINFTKYIGLQDEQVAENESITIVANHLHRQLDLRMFPAKSYLILMSILKTLQTAIEFYSLRRNKVHYSIYFINNIAFLINAIESRDFELLQFPHFTKTVLDDFSVRNIKDLNTFNPSYSPSGQEIDDEQFDANLKLRKEIFMANMIKYEKVNQNEAENYWSDVEKFYNNIPYVSTVFFRQSKVVKVTLLDQFERSEFTRIPFEKRICLWIILAKVTDQTVIASKFVILKEKTENFEEIVSFEDLEFNSNEVKVYYSCDSFVGGYSSGEAEIQDA